jgi:hypothetical protein
LRYESPAPAAYSRPKDEYDPVVENEYVTYWPEEFHHPTLGKPSTTD